MKKVLAVDGGNSKTLAAIADEGGRVLALVKDGGCNFQGTGRKGAALVLDRAIKKALKRAAAEEVEAACYGIAGADRDRDFEIIREFLAPLDPSKKSVLVNDTLLALRAGTADGVGVALIGGAGSNCIGMDRASQIKKAWGLGPLTGDKANAYALVHDAMVAAMKGVDGRGPRTILEEKFKQALEVRALEDVIEFEYADSRKGVDFGALAPLVFAAADEGDQAALNILRGHGEAAAEAALAVMRGLFAKGDRVPLVLGGSIYQKGTNLALVDRLREVVSGEYPRAELILLSAPPILGGILRAFDELGVRLAAEIEEKIKGELSASLSGLESGERT